MNAVKWAESLKTARILTFPLPSCVTLGKSLTLSGFQHLYYKIEAIGGFMSKFVHEAPATGPGTQHSLTMIVSIGIIMTILTILYEAEILVSVGKNSSETMEGIVKMLVSGLFIFL